MKVGALRHLVLVEWAHAVWSDASPTGGGRRGSMKEGEEGRGEGSEGMGGGREEVERRGWEGGESLHQCSAFHAHYLLEWLGQSLTL